MATSPFEGLSRAAILRWLREDDPARLEELWAAADETRRRHVGDEVHLRGLIEISNYCVRACGYCGLRAGNREVERYRMSEDEILDCARNAAAWGWGTVVMQSGEDYGLDTAWIAGIVRCIKAETPHPEDAARARLRAGQRRDGRHPRADLCERRHRHRHLPRPRPRHDRHRPVHRASRHAARRPQLAARGPRGRADPQRRAHRVQGRGAHAPRVPAVQHPQHHGLATINKVDGRELGLQRGANIVMPNLTPPEYREKYEIYPDKACVNETAEMCRGCLQGRVESIGRVVGSGPGGRRRAGSR